jgi:beta-lactamase regulating signal transducer with metallopeptidase domain
MPNALMWNLLLTAALAVVLAVLCRLPWFGRRPALRHWLWLLVLVKLVTPPLVAVPLLPVVGDGTAATAIFPAAPTERGEGAFDQPLQASTQPSLEVDGATPTPAVGDAGKADSQECQRWARAFFLEGLLTVSLIGTCVLVTFHGVHAVRLHRWLRRAGTENAILAASCADVAASLAVRGVVRTCVIDARTTPLLWAWGQPLVVVPRQFMDGLGPQQLRSVVAHELAHLVRRDHWANGFVFIVKTLLWWNPVVWWADRELRAAQELCCDAIAIDRCNADRRGYATTLLKALDFIQAEPFAPRALVVGMGSRGSILRRFEMIGEKRLSYQLSRWTFLVLLASALPLLCIPVRGQAEGPAAATSDTGPAAEEGVKTEEADKPKTGDAVDAPAMDPKIKALGEAVKKRITTYSDEATLTLKNGETGRMKVKKNVTSVTEFLITPRFVENGTKFDIEGVDATGKAIEGAKTTSQAIHNAETMRMAMGTLPSVNGENTIAKIQLHPTRQGDNTVAVEVKVLFTRMPTSEEIKAMLMTQGKSGRTHSDFQTIGLWVAEYQTRNGRYPTDLKELNKTLPKDANSPTGENYGYEARRDKFILGSCGKDGIYGNDDDEIMITYRGGATSGLRRELYPLQDDKGAEARKEQVVGARPQGKCSISGKVVSEATGKPVDNARMYLHYNVTHGSIFVNTDSEGNFEIKDIPTGPFSLCSSHTAGYQDAAYSPEGKPGPYPPFSLKDGEHRTGIVLKLKEACRISGKVVDEKGEMPRNIDTLTVLAWFKHDGSMAYGNEQARVNRSDGSYVIDGLANKPCYVMAINWRAAQRGEADPPIYHPSTFSRKEAKQITFDKGRSVEYVDITLKKEGGLVLEGTVRDEAGKPVPEVFVVVHRCDMLFDFVTAYTDEQGHYEIQGLGEGEFQVHLDAVHRGFVRIRMPINFDGAAKKIHRDFSLTKGVVISGKFVDEQGKDWEIGESHGYVQIATDEKNEKETSSGFSLTHFWNKHRPEDAQQSSGGSFALGEGGYNDSQMLYPTKNTFVIQGMMAGKTMIGFSPQKEGQKVVKILHNGQDVMKSGIVTKPGQEIKDVTVVIGAK